MEREGDLNQCQGIDLVSTDAAQGPLDSAHYRQGTWGASDPVLNPTHGEICCVSTLSEVMGRVSSLETLKGNPHKT